MALECSAATAVGTSQTRLIVLRGPSGAGKTTTARSLRARLGRSTALVQQDVVRRQILREHDVPGGVNIGLIDAICRHSLESGYDVILEGILHAERYGTMLRRLVSDHRGRTVTAFFAVPFDETVRRHATRPQADEFTVSDMEGWYVAHDHLGLADELMISETSSVEESVNAVLASFPPEEVAAELARSQP